MNTYIYNTPDYAVDYAYIVARYVDGNYWFYGAWNDLNRANEVALEVDGVVFDN